MFVLKLKLLYKNVFAKKFFSNIFIMKKKDMKHKQK